MRRAFPEAMVRGYEHLVDSMTNDPKDRHVLAAAVAGGAGLLLTSNLRHFPRTACDLHGIRVQSPDEFLCEATEGAPDVMAEVIRAQAARKVRRPMSVEEMLDRLATQIPRFVATIRPSV